MANRLETGADVAHHLADLVERQPLVIAQRQLNEKIALRDYGK
jgi:hypothetical protein